MGQTFIVQIKITGKWTFVTRGRNRDQIQSVYDSSVIEYGSSAARILMSNGKKEDGSDQWTIVEMQKKPELVVSIDKNAEKLGGASKLTLWSLIIISGAFILIVGGMAIYKTDNPRHPSVTPALTSEVINIPTMQKAFELKRNYFYDSYIDAQNEIKKSAIWIKANSEAKNFGRKVKWKLTNWRGRVTDISTDQGGDVVSIIIVSDTFGTEVLYKTWNNRLSDVSDGTMPKKGSKVYNQISELSIGEDVIFSAKLLRDSEKGIKESSMTELGSLEKPEFIVRFTDISGISN